MIELLSATTAESDSDPFYVIGRNRPARFSAPGLASGESAVIQQKEIDGNFYDCYIDTVKQEITDTHNTVTVYGPGVYRVHKLATAVSVPVGVATDENP